MKKWRKLRIAFWVAALAVLIGWNAGAVKEVRAESYNGYKYSVKDDGTVVITGYSGNERELVIPEEIKGRKVTEIGERAMHYCKVTSLTIPESVTSIANSSLSQCIGLTEIKVDPQNTVYDSREDCNAIIKTRTNELVLGCCNTKIPEGVIRIGDNAFYQYNSLTGITMTGITIPESVTSIGEHAFAYCSGLTEIRIPESATSIGDFAFSGCSSLTEIRIPESVTSIGKSVFWGAAV